MPRKPAPRAAADDAVDAFLAALDHPMAPTIHALREAVRGADPAVAESIKWNAPSFRTVEHFATMQLRARDRVLLVLHFGAARRGAPRPDIADPDGLLAWLGPDRATVAFAGAADVADRRDALRAVLRQWIAHL